MAEWKITKINLRPIQEFTGDRMMQVQRYNRSLRTGISDSMQYARTLTHRTFVASLGLGGLLYDGAWRTMTDSWEYLEKAEQRGEEIEQNVVTSVGERVNQLETQANAELRKVRIPLPSAPSVPSVPGSQIVSRQFDWTVRRISIRRRSASDVRTPLPGYDDLSAQQIIAETEGMDGEALANMRAYEAKGEARPSVLRAIDTALEKEMAVV